MDDIFVQAEQARSNAEKTNNPALYRQAAGLFNIIGMQAAAQRMIDRAEHYEKLRDGILS